MSKILVLTSLLLLFVAAASPQGARKLDDLKWMVGCWESRDDVKHLFLSEQWMKPAGGMMIGVGRTVKNGKAVGFEFMRIEQQGVDISFISRPKENKDDTIFSLLKWGPDEVIFENPAHDFPQRIIYRRQGGRLIGRIEGKENGKFQGIDFPMIRAKCE